MFTSRYTSKPCLLNIRAIALRCFKIRIYYLHPVELTSDFFRGIFRQRLLQYENRVQQTIYHHSE